MQTKPSPNMPRARMPAPPRLPEMFHLEEVPDFPAEVVHVVGLTKAAFNAVPNWILHRRPQRTLRQSG
jgi:hypothetical protein